jgi:hypothetical protein
MLFFGIHHLYFLLWVFWVSEFECEGNHTNDEPYSGRPKTATTLEIVDKIHDVVLADHWIKVHEIAEAVTMSYERDFHILHNEFDLKKISANFLLTPESGAKTHSISNTRWVFGSVSKASNGFQETICDYGWDLDLPLCTGNKESVKAVDWTKWIGSEESKNW